MREITAVKNCESKIENETGSRDSLPSVEMIRIPVFVLTLTVTLLIFTLGSESAHSQCAGLCLYDMNTHETKIPSAGVEIRYENPATTDSGVEGSARTVRALAATDLLGESSRQNSGLSHSERTRVSQGLSDKFATNELYATEGVGESSGISVYAANDA